MLLTQSQTTAFFCPYDILQENNQFIFIKVLDKVVLSYFKIKWPDWEGVKMGHYNGQNPYSSQNTDLNKGSEQNSSSRRIKASIEIAHSQLEFQISKKIKMSSKVNEISNLTWKTGPSKYQINILASRLWIAGTFTGQITYTKTSDSLVHQQSISLPWKKTFGITFLYPPVIPLNDEIVHYNLPQDNQVHYEQTIYHHDSPELTIETTKLLTSQQTAIIQNSAYLILDINCEMEYSIFQKQIVSL
jgi:hypothetical protein